MKLFLVAFLMSATIITSTASAQHGVKVKTPALKKVVSKKKLVKKKVASKKKAVKLIKPKGFEEFGRPWKTKTIKYYSFMTDPTLKAGFEEAVKQINNLQVSVKLTEGTKKNYQFSVDQSSSEEISNIAETDDVIYGVATLGDIKDKGFIFLADQMLTDNMGVNEVSLVAAHELLHILGVGHYNNPKCSIMQIQIDVSICNHFNGCSIFAKDDLDALKYLYGTVKKMPKCNPDFKPVMF